MTVNILKVNTPKNRRQRETEKLNEMDRPSVIPASCLRRFSPNRGVSGE